MKNKNQILSGVELAQKIKLSLAKQIAQLEHKPGLAVVLVGDNEASKMYIKIKEKACNEVGINFHKYLCNHECMGEIDQEAVIGLIKFLNNDESVDGILLQLPLPEKYETTKIIEAIDPKKDVDGFFSVGKVDDVVPPTIAAVIELLKATEEDLQDKKTLVIAKSDIYTAKMEKYLANFGLSKIKVASDIPADSADYDIIIIALGKAGAIREEMVKDGVILIDVGINKVGEETVGDVDVKCYNKASYFSPVPGGVGPLTVACLLRNVYELLNKFDK